MTKIPPSGQMVAAGYKKEAQVGAGMRFRLLPGTKCATPLNPTYTTVRLDTGTKHRVVDPNIESEIALLTWGAGRRRQFSGKEGPSC